MNSNEAKRIVSEGLEQRRIERNQRESALDDQERKLRLTINNNHTARTMTDTQKIEKVMKEHKARVRASQKKKASAILSVQYYVRACIGIFLATLLTPIPWWAAVTLVVGCAVFPTAHIIRLEVSA